MEHEIYHIYYTKAPLCCSCWPHSPYAISQFIWVSESTASALRRAQVLTRGACLTRPIHSHLLFAIESLFVCVICPLSTFESDCHPHARNSPIAATQPSYIRQTLDGPNWYVSNSNGTIEHRSATVPGNIYLDLLANGILKGDPLYRDSETYFQWVAYEDWTWETTFDRSTSLESFASTVLEFEGIDTVASITLNNQPIGQTKDMHLRYTFDVTPILKPIGNVLRITIYSAITQGKLAADAYPYVGQA